MDGVEVMKEIRAQPAFRTVPLVVFSNMFLTNLVRDAWKAGATKCLSKVNCTPRQVIEAVRSALPNDAQPIAVAEPPPVAPNPALPQQPAMDTASDPEIQARVRAVFLANLPSTLTSLRSRGKELTKAPNEPARLQGLRELSSQIHSFTGSAALADLPEMAQLAEALEALLKDLCEKPRNIAVSPLRTVSLAIDMLGRIFKHLDKTQNQDLLPPRILVVDDEAISRRAIMKALEKAKLSALGLDEPIAAYNLLAGNTFDLVFLDVDMPGMTGFELCAKLRALPMHKHTPVVFVTSMDDFESRASSSASGGTDYIVKPFLFVELAVKALIHVFRRRLSAPAAAGA
jgi:CheY-like chemotaxis protein